MARAVCRVSPDKLTCQCIGGAPPLTRAPAICKDSELFLCLVAPLLKSMAKKKKTSVFVRVRRGGRKRVRYQRKDGEMKEEEEV